ncbi:hypothetical protein TA3x_000600 [Tundrisphaera sp. TA3]|uniref:hypothetical protein n=1 Tax=Tundrisphaera sp. TA3 TaxID=3435775 RepID=UPI003EB75749
MQRAMGPRHLRANAMELHEALRQISDIRSQMARAEVYRGFRSLTVAGSGVLALLAAASQPHWVPSPEVELERYLGLWVGVAAVGLAAAGFEMARKARRDGAGLARRSSLVAAEQFLPCVFVGGLLTLCIARGAPHVAWMLPGLWALVFSLGIFASRRLLPRSVVWVGVHYVLSGCACLMAGPGPNWLAPWQMALTFGVGQLLGAAILYWNLERADATQG